MNIIKNLKNPFTLLPALTAAKGFVEEQICKPTKTCTLKVPYSSLPRPITNSVIESASVCELQYPPGCAFAAAALNLASQANGLFIQKTIGQNGLNLIYKGYNALFPSGRLRARRVEGRGLQFYRPSPTLNERIKGVGLIVLGAVLTGGVVFAISAQCQELLESLSKS